MGEVSYNRAMVDIRPFRGLRFSPAHDLAQVISPPYDVISADEQSELLERSPRNIVRVELPRAEGADPYQQAAGTLREWCSDGTLLRDDPACMYLYEARFHLGDEARARRSLVAGLRLESWDSGQVLPHERTFSGPKEDRLRLLKATRANVSPIWTLYRGGSDALGRAWEAADAGPADSACELEDGTCHRLWRVDDPDLLDSIRVDFGAVRLVIADGHHRYETALNYREELAAGGELDSGDPSNFVLVHLVAEEDPGLAILPIHRVVRNLGDLDQVDLESELGADWHGEYFPVWENAPPEQLKALLVQLHSEGETERVVGLFGPDTSIFAILILRNKQLMEQRAPDRSEAWRGLDVALLEEGLLKPLLQNADATAEESVAYQRDPYAALQAVLRGDYQIAMFLNGTKPEQVIAVAEAGDRMPQKSTYFYPKIPTGLVIRELI